MADAVQVLIEEMVPELQELGEHKLLTKEEIRTIVKRRTDFEYRLRKRAAEKNDFMKYIEYEDALDKLLCARKNKLAKKIKFRDSKFASIKNIHFIYERCLRKFKQDIGLWLEWIAFAKSQKSTKMLSKILARALQLHPRKAVFWLTAANYEWEEGNVTAARVMFQRALRLNPKEKELWHAYLKMEILFVGRILKRRRILGLDDKGQQDSKKETLDIPSLEEEEKKEDKEEGGGAAARAQEQEAPDLSFLRHGDIPKAVIEFALRSNPGDPAFLLSLLEVCEEAEEEDDEEELAEELRRFLLDLIDESFWGLPGCMLRRAARGMKEASTRGFAGACDDVEKMFSEYMRRRRKNQEEEEEEEEEAGKQKRRKERDAQWEAICTFWKETVNQLAPKQHEEERKIARDKLIKAIKNAEEDGSRSELIFIELAAAVRSEEEGEGRKGDKKRSRKSLSSSDQNELEVLKRARRAIPASSRIASLYLQSFARSLQQEQLSVQEKAAQLKQQMKEVLQSCDKDETAVEVWKDRIKLEARSNSLPEMVEAFVQAVSPPPSPPPLVADLISTFLLAVRDHYGSGRRPQACALALEKPLPSSVRSGLVRAWAEVELEEAAPMNKTRIALERWAEEEEAKKSVDLWIKWEEAERAAGEHKRAAGVQWRATRTLEDATEYHKERSMSNG